MCDKCRLAVDLAIGAGINRRDAMGWLWDRTAFPVEPPTEEQIQEMIKSLKP